LLIVQVEIPGRARSITCRVESRAFEIGDRCVVDTGGRRVVGTVSRVPLDLPWEQGKPPGRVIRPARRRDDEGAAHAEAKASRLVERAQKIADELKVPLKILRSEVRNDGNRVVLIFVADGRVDFRELVRRLAREFKARVELRQVGVRDGAMLQGGMGHCGRELCCSKFLTSFRPVSMKMAKVQGLPVNPARISGRCGRLMCCLRYEIDESGKFTGAGCRGSCREKRAESEE